MTSGKDDSKALEPVPYCVRFLDSVLADRWSMGQSTQVILRSIRRHLLDYQDMIDEQSKQAHSSKNS